MEIRSLVSVIITTKNEEDVIATLLQSIVEQSYKNIEILLIDNNSTDKTLEIAGKFPVQKYTYGPERSAQRNFGAGKAKGKFLLFLDADMELSLEVIKECVEAFDKGKNIGGVIVPEQSVACSFWESVKAFERSFYNLEGDNITDAARFFSKEAFKSVGGYDETITGPEDWDLPENIKKKGFQLIRIKAMIKHNERIPSLFSLMRKKYYYGLRSHRYLKKQKISTLSPKTVYFLRPVFYKNWRKLIAHPIMSTVMFYMLFMELIAGGLGFIVGNFSDTTRK